jgi:hypothetical protein
MNRTISQRKAAGECKNKKCTDCDKCFLHPLLGVACGIEYPASFNRVLQEEDDEEEWW